ncbi:MAG: cytidylate kinase family protein [Merdibacter sp.]
MKINKAARMMNMSRKIIITISRQYGSAGRIIGQQLAKELGIAFMTASFGRYHEEAGRFRRFFP